VIHIRNKHKKAQNIPLNEIKENTKAMSILANDQDDDLSQFSEGDLSIGEDDDDISYSSDESVDEKQRMPDTKEKSNQNHFSDTRTVSVASSSSLSNSVLSDLAFAPPPEIPEKLHNSRILAKDAPPNASTLPNWNDITHSGSILARISARSRIMKKWKECFWITYGKSKVLLFRSKSDFDEWASNPDLTDRQRYSLIKSSVDFVLDYVNDIHMLGYQVSETRLKYYNHKVEFLHQFKLEKRMVFGTLIAAAFASTEKSETSSLHAILMELAHKHQQTSPVHASCPAIAQG
jgi:hypothetical protein